MGKLGSMGMKKKANVVSIGSMRITPAKQMKFHRKEAVKSLKKNNFQAYRFHTLKVSNITIRQEIAKLKAKKS